MKVNHPFDPQKGEPAYWFRNDPIELERHRQMMRDHERIHLLRTPTIPSQLQQESP